MMKHILLMFLLLLFSVSSWATTISLRTNYQDGVDTWDANAVNSTHTAINTAINGTDTQFRNITASHNNRLKKVEAGQFGNVSTTGTVKILNGNLVVMGKDNAWHRIKILGNGFNRISTISYP